MVNMFGMGRAFNLRYVQHSAPFMPQVRMAPRGPIGIGQPVNITNNYTIKAGPSGFGGWLLGLATTLPFIGLLAGGFRRARYSYPAINNYSTQQYAWQTNGVAQNQVALTNLNKLYGAKGFNIVANNDGTFTATDKNGNNIAVKKSYDEITKILGEKQGAAAPVEDTGAGVGTGVDAGAGAGTGGVAQGPKVGAGTGAGAGSGKVDEGASVVDEDGAAVVDEGGAGSVVEAEDGSVVEVPTNKPAKRTGQDLSGWYRIGKKTPEAKAVKSQIDAIHQKNGKVTAQSIVDTLLKNKMDYLSKKDREDLVNLMIANNPSVFDENGNELTTPNWEKLDLPSVDSLKKRYIKDGKSSYDKKTGKVSYTDQNDQKVKEKSNIGDQNNKIIRGENGYWVELKLNGPVYHNPNGKIIDKDEFAENCKNIAKTVESKYKNGRLAQYSGAPNNPINQKGGHASYSGAPNKA